MSMVLEQIMANKAVEHYAANRDEVHRHRSAKGGKNMMKRYVVLAAFAIMFVAPVFAQTNQPSGGFRSPAEKEKMKVAITVDGTDKIFIKSNELWIVHESFELPRDIKINGKKWVCQWDNNTSDRYTKLDPPFVPRPGSAVDVRKLQGRVGVQLIQSPSSANDFTAIIQIVDVPTGADKYAFEISWTK